MRRLIQMLFQSLIGITDIAVCAKLLEPVQCCQKPVAYNALLLFDVLDFRLLCLLLLHPVKAAVKQGSKRT